MYFFVIFELLYLFQFALLDFCVLLDLKKDLDHNFLLKLKKHVIRGPSSKLLESYLNSRMQFVDFAALKSEALYRSHCVPHESLLGLLLF